MRRPGKALVALVVAAGVVGLAGGGAFLALRGGGSASAVAVCPAASAGPAGSAAGAAPAGSAGPVGSAAPAGSAGPEGSAAPAVGSGVGVTIDVPVSVSAGTPVAVRIHAAAEPDGSPVRLVILRGDAPAARDLTVSSGTAETILPPALTTAAGRVTLTALTCAGEATAALDIRPGLAAGTLLPLVGPKRIAAGSGSEATVVVLAQDAQGNAVADGTAMHVQVRRPDGTVEASTVDTAHLLGVARVAAGTVAGETTVAAGIGSDVRGSAAQLLETAGAPAPGFAIAIEGPRTAVVGNGERRVVLRGLTDAHGNRLDDGLLVEVLVREPDGTERTEQAPLIAGGVDVPLDSPAVPGTVRVRLRIAGVDSAEATADYAEPTTAAGIPLTATYDPAIRAIRVAIGPIVGELGAFAPDGSEVVLTASGAHGWVDQRVLRLTDGAAIDEIPVAARETSVHLFVRSPFGRTEAIVTIPGGAAGPSIAPSPTPEPAATASPALDLPGSGS